jgi:copper homeostasis protein
VLARHDPLPRHGATARGGDFLYTDIEVAAMLADVRALRGLGIAGVVVGCLTPDGEIDEARMRAPVDAAPPLSVTCDRAFDMRRAGGRAETSTSLVRLPATPIGSPNC